MAKAGAVPDLAVARIRTFCERQIPPEVTDQIRLEVGVRGRFVTIFECRPPWMPELGPEWTRLKVAQLRWDPEMELWSLHWADRNGRWHVYDGWEAVLDIDELLDEIDRDPTCIFWG